MRLRPLVTATAIRHELVCACKLGATASARVQLCLDVLLFRMLGIGFRPGFNQLRTVRVQGDLVIHYRLNRGDIQSIREVWYDRAYSSPVTHDVSVIVDLGANIGLTSLWLYKEHNPHLIVSVEPSEGNYLLAEKNLADNGITAKVIHAAIGSSDGTGFFEESSQSNLGQLSDTGNIVDVISMQTVLDLLPGGSSIDLLKIDIEGGEEDLLDGDLAWLGAVKALLIEFHPDRVDMPALISRLQGTGFRYVPGGTVHARAVDCFVNRTAD